MAITASGLILQTWEGNLDGTLNLNLDLETHKIALFDNTITPNFNTDTVYGAAPYDSGEINGAGYTAGGATLTGTALSIATGSIYWDADDVEWPNSTITGAKGGLIYADGLNGEGIVLVNFGAEFSTSNGLFKIQWHTDGILELDGTP